MQEMAIIMVLVLGTEENIRDRKNEAIENKARESEDRENAAAAKEVAAAKEAAAKQDAPLVIHDGISKEFNRLLQRDSLRRAYDHFMRCGRQISFGHWGHRIHKSSLLRAKYVLQPGKAMQHLQWYDS